MQLEEHGYAVIEAADGIEALRLVGRHRSPLHLVVADVVMPRMSGRALVEGILAHIQESPDGRVALLHVKHEGEDAFGLLALYKTGPLFEAVAVDAHGRERPDWAELLTRRPLKSRRVSPESWASQPGWPQLIRNLAPHIEERGRPIAIAAFRLGD